MSFDPYKALYIHIPFCKSRCAYCDFATDAIKSDSKIVRNYLDKLIYDLRDASKKGKLEEIETIYIGGGTPTHLGHDKLVELIYFLSTTLSMRKITEFTIEANPESLTEEMVKDIYSLGVNRISIGVQSFDDGLLKILSRAHTSKEARNAISIAKTRFKNVSIDLMCGIPTQSLDMWEKDISAAIEMGIQHISVYPLTIEPKTKFYKLCMRGKMPWPDDDLQADMMQKASEILTKAKFHRYEVASYALDGFESKHNSAYWSGVPYLGIGKSATTMTQNEDRRMREKDGFIVDDLDKPQMAAEDIMLGFRMSRGVTDEKIQESTDLLPDLPNKLKELEDKGLIKRDEGAFVPTQKGWLCGNELYGEIFDLA